MHHNFIFLEKEVGGTMDQGTLRFISIKTVVILKGVCSGNLVQSSQVEKQTTRKIFLSTIKTFWCNA